MFRGRIHFFALAAGVSLLAASASVERGYIAAVAEAATDAPTAIRDRSPGERTGAQLIKTKRESLPERFARALPRVRDAHNKPKIGKSSRDVLPAAFEPLQPSDILDSPPALASTAPFKFEDAPGAPSPGAPTGGGDGFIFPGGGGGGGGGADTAPSDTARVAPGVPEPATWLNLIFGFAALGWTLRLRRARSEVRA